MPNKATLGIFFETCSLVNNEAAEQYIIVPSDSHSDGIIVWGRVAPADGTRSVWKEQHPQGIVESVQSLTKRPVSFVLTHKMCDEIVRTSWSYPMPSAGLRSHERADSYSSSLLGTYEYQQIISELFKAVQNRDSAFLNNLLKNEKRINEVPVVSIQSVAGASSTPVPAAPVVAAPVVQAPVAPVPAVSSDDTYKAVLYPASYADSYIHRTIHGVEDFAVLDAALALKQNVLLQGDTGSAKTTFVKAWAAARGLRVAQVTGTPQNDAYRVIGKQVLDHGTSRFQPGLLHELFRHGGVLLLDEVDLNPDGFLSELFPTLRERVLTLHDSGGESLFAHDNFIVVATMNGTRGYRRRELDAAMKNRFTHIIDWRYLPEVEKSLGIVPSVADLALGLRKQFYAEELTTPIPTNALLDFQTLAKSIGIEYAIGNFVARFNGDEQQAVQLVISGMRSNIVNDLKVGSQ